MNDILDFLISHWQLSVIFILVVGAYLVYEYMMSSDSTSISPEEAVAIINHEHGVVIDVRTPEEYAAGHILNSINVAFDAPAAKYKHLNKYATKPVILVCANGTKSAQSIGRIKEHGCTRVHNIAGGIQAWQEVGLPLINK